MSNQEELTEIGNNGISIENDDDHWMILSQTERATALTLKRAAKESGDFDTSKLTDMVYAHYAVSLHDSNDVQAMLERMSQLVAFKEEYDVRDTVEDAMATLAAFWEKEADLWLYLDHRQVQPSGGGEDSPPRGEYAVLIGDSTKANHKAVMSMPESNWRNHVVAHYYLWQACFSHLSAAREGLVSLWECDGWGRGWRNHRATTARGTRFYGEFMCAYPMKCKYSMMYNTPSFVNIVIALLKPFMKKEVKNSLLFGCKWTDIDEFAGANNAISRITDVLPHGCADLECAPMAISLKANLERRLRNEKKFQLEPE